jgi:hypothetical protein
MTYVAVAAKISTLLTVLKIANIAPKIAVNTTIKLIRNSVVFSALRTKIVRTGIVDARIVAKILLVLFNVESLYNLNPNSSSISFPLKSRKQSAKPSLNKFVKNIVL